MYHLLDLDAEEADEGELEEPDDTEADDEERVGRGVQPVADGAPAALVVVPVGAHAVGKPAVGTEGTTRSKMIAKFELNFGASEQGLLQLANSSPAPPVLQ